MVTYFNYKTTIWLKEQYYFNQWRTRMTIIAPTISYWKNIP